MKDSAHSIFSRFYRAVSHQLGPERTALSDYTDRCTTILRLRIARGELVRHHHGRWQADADDHGRHQRVRARANPLAL
jgi:hypothetical protein